MTRATKTIIVCAVAVVTLILGSEIFKTVRFRKYCESTREMKTRIDTVSSFSSWSRRGNIFDCKGNVLATIDTVYGVHLDAMAAKDSLWAEVLPVLSKGLAEILQDRMPSEYYIYLKNGRAAQRRYLKICEDVGQSTLDSLKSLPLFNLSMYSGGVIIETNLKRVYPYGPMARRTIGFVRNNNELYNNHIGIEGYFNKFLSGVDGYEVIKNKHVRLPFGKVKRIRKTIKKVEPQNGKDVTVTLDIELQATADS